MHYQKLCEVYEQLEKNPSRLVKTEIHILRIVFGSAFLPLLVFV